MPGARNSTQVSPVGGWDQATWAITPPPSPRKKLKLEAGLGLELRHLMRDTGGVPSGFLVSYGKALTPPFLVLKSIHVSQLRYVQKVGKTSEVRCSRAVRTKVTWSVVGQRVSRLAVGPALSREAASHFSWVLLPYPDSSAGLRSAHTTAKDTFTFFSAHS